MEFRSTIIHDGYDSGSWLWHLETLSGMELAKGSTKDKESARKAAREAALARKTDKNAKFFQEIISV